MEICPEILLVYTMALVRDMIDSAILTWNLLVEHKRIGY